MRIIIIGSGRVGCGALGVALALQGHELVFAARQPNVVDSINRLGFDVDTKGAISAHVEVRGVRAVVFGSYDFIREVAQREIHDRARCEARAGALPSRSREKAAGHAVMTTG